MVTSSSHVWLCASLNPLPLSAAYTELTMVASEHKNDNNVIAVTNTSVP
ncbi:MAG: hypothetical protein ACJ72Q_17645 [Nitrososphaeraceae archaeon]